MNFKHTAISLKKELQLYMSHLSVYIKYQLITKGFLFLIVVPLIYGIGSILLNASNHTALSSGNIKDVLSSLHITGFFAIVLIIFLLTVIVDISAFIVISASIKETGHPIKISYAIKQGFKSVKKFFSPAGLFLIIYTLLITPLVGIGLKSSFISHLKIPNFITSVIYNSPLYLTLYLTIIVILGIIGFFLLLSFHFMQLHGDKAMDSIKNSIKTIWVKKFSMIVNFIAMNGVVIVLASIILISMHFSIELLDGITISNLFLSRFLMVFALLIFAEFLNFCFFLIWPLQIHMLTSRFYLMTKNNTEIQNTEKENHEISASVLSEAFKQNIHKTKKSTHKRKVRIAICLLIIFNLLTATLCAFFFDEMFHYRKDISIVAHRGGGNLAAENTILGLEKAYQAGAKWSEIDVMRSKDGVYIINHDNTFKRLTGNSKKPSELTWKEIQQLKVKDAFDNSRPSAEVPSLDAIMDASKGKIGLLIELKGKDADKKMADDVVKSIIDKGMKDEAIIIGLDYKLIQYIENKYPEIQTGYLYFFGVGGIEDIKVDYLLMEESAVNAYTIESIHKAKKKAFVWTVNNSSTLSKLFDAEVDGIITDNILELKEAITQWDKKTDKDIILDEINNLLLNR